MRRFGFWVSMTFVVTVLGCKGATDPVVLTFLDGTPDNPEIGVVVNSLERTLQMFQLGSPDTTRTVELGSSAAVTPVGLDVYEYRVVVPLGNAASVAVIDARAPNVESFFLFPSGNATGAAFFDVQTVFAANLTEGYVGRFYTNQTNAAIVDTLRVTPAPTAVVTHGSLVYVISANLDASFVSLGQGMLTTIEPGGMTIFDTVSTGGINPSSAAVGNDGRLYIVNTGNWVDQGSLAIVNLASRTLAGVIPNMGVGPGHVTVDDAGLVYISGFFFGTIVWNSQTQTFVRGLDNPLCAPVTGGGCRGAFSSAVAQNGDVYQSFFGSPAQGLAPAIFVYSAGTFALRDSIAVGSGPAQLVIADFP